MTKRKEERRELLKEDEFLSFMERAVRFAQNQSQKVAVIAVAAIAVVALIIGGAHLHRAQKMKASAELYEAEKIIDTSLDDPYTKLGFEDDTQRLETALKSLDRVLAESSGEVADQARVQKIRCLIDLGRDEEVLPLYRELANSSNVFKAFGLLGIGDYLRNKGQHDEALAAYNQLLADGDLKLLFEDLVKYHMAQCFHGKGDHTTARNELEALIAKLEARDQSQQSPILPDARDLLEQVNREDTAEPQAG